MKTRYFHSRFYSREFKRLKARGQTFEVEKTTYTKKITYGAIRMIFNNEGDIDNNVLSLISAVRKDASNYIAKTSYEEINRLNDERGKINFFNMLNLINDEDVVVKVDVKSAYWEHAMKKGIITEETNNKYKKLFEGVDIKIAKDARLKALGSLATSKLRQKYSKGKLVKEEVTVQPTKPLYMLICSGIDDLMNELSRSIDGCFYYYWDCIFVGKQHEKEAIDFLRNKGYSTTSQETQLQYMKFGNTGYIFSISDNKVYMTRKETAHLVDEDYGKEDDQYYLI